MEFCAELARRMVVAGANLERVELAIFLICRAYGMSDVSILLLSTHLSLSAMDRDGSYVSRQVSIPGSSIHLEKLKSLNRLSFTVVRETPPEEKLPAMLNDASLVDEYRDLTVLIARIGSMICLCLMFGGGWTEAAATGIITALLHFVERLVNNMDLNRLVGSAVTMCAATILSMLFYRAGLCRDASVVITALCMLFIPGIALTNAVRNLFCDHEMNGILQLMKVLIETTAIAAGIYAGVFLLKGKGDFGTDMVTSVSEPLLLIGLSIVSTMLNAVTFQVPPHDLWRTGIGGLITRVALICLPLIIPYRIVYTGLATLLASLYAEYLARKRRDPSTYFVYPAILPLVPGGLFFNMIMGLLYHDWSRALTNGYDCLITLLGISLGFVISSSAAHYIRKVRADINKTNKAIVDRIIKIFKRL